MINRSSAIADIELRGDGRTVHGIAVPFDTPTEIREFGGSYTETFRRGAFTRTLAERGANRIKLMAVHAAASFPLGRLSSAVEDAAGLRIEARLSATQAGDEALQLVRDGALDAFSIGFSPVTGGDRWDRARSAVERLQVRLHEVSLVAFPAYDGAVIDGIRSADGRPYDPDFDPEFVARQFRLATFL